MTVELLTLKILAALAEDGSLRRVASSLGIDKNTVARHIDLLERTAGVPLFEKRTSGTKLTQAGKIALSAADDVFNSLVKFEGILRSVGDDHRRPVTVSAPEGVGTYLLGPQSIGFEVDQPAPLKMAYAELPPITILPMDQVADIEITLVNPGDDVHRSTEYKVKKLGVMSFLPVASRGYLERNSTPQNKKDLTRAAILDHVNYSRLRAFSGWSDISHDRNDGPIVNVSTSSALHRAVLTGRGIALLPDFSAEIDPSVVVLPIIPRFGIELWAATRPEMLKLPTVKRAWDVIGDGFHRSPWFKGAM